MDNEKMSWLAEWQIPAPIDFIGLLWLALTFVAYVALARVAQRFGRNAVLAVFFNPMLTTALAMGLVLWALSHYHPPAFADYMRGGAWFLLFLTPALITLAQPLYDALQEITAQRKAVLWGLGAGFIASLASVALLALVIELTPTLQGAMWLKSVTSAMAIVVAPKIAVSAVLAAGFVIVAGVIGVLFAPLLFRLFRITEPAAQGLALGIAAHAIGVISLLQAGSRGAPFAALGMGINALLTAFLLPFLLGAF